MWHVWRKGELCTRFWWGNLRERDHWGDQDVDGRRHHVAKSVQANLVASCCTLLNLMQRSPYSAQGFALPSIKIQVAQEFSEQDKVS